MVHIFLGTRAQVIKMSPVMHELNKRGIEYNYVFVAQHHETIVDVHQKFDLKQPDYTYGNTGYDISTVWQMIRWVIRVNLHSLFHHRRMFLGDKDGVVIVHGDALPMLFGAIAGKLQRLKVYHVEAGLRSYNLLKPLPEELTRYLAARLGLLDVFFCQDDQAIENVSKYTKKDTKEAIYTNGNTMRDSVLMAAKVNKNRTIPQLPDEKFVLVTLHRYENLSDEKRMRFIVKRMKELSKDIKVLILLHPITRKVLVREGYFEELKTYENIELLPRQTFIDFNLLFSQCEFVISDGGSNQEESSYLGVPCLLFRTETERLEGLDSNVVLSKFDPDVIDDFITNYKKYKKKTENEGKSPTEIVVDRVEKHLEEVENKKGKNK